MSDFAFTMSGEEPVDEGNLKLSDQALGAVMMALQKSLMEQSDIVPVLKGFDFDSNDGGELIVLNPPVVSLEPDVEDQD